jgi:pimeloyl-ACP methyl ester carboxylesterase
VGVRREPRPGDRARRPRRPDPRGHPLAVPARRAGPEPVSPDTWEHDHALVSREGNDEIQLALFRDYRSNRPLYPALQEFLRTHEVPVLAVWGRNDEIFGPAGAQAFARDAKDAEVHLVDGGHFLLESHLDVVAGHLRAFLGRVLR